jgi:hypothetical protein
MHRRSWLKLSLGAAAVLALGGGAMALIEPAWRDGRLTSAGRLVFMHAGRAFLDGALPTDDDRRAEALAGLLDRTDALIAALPAHAQRELSQLLSLLATAPGRRTLAGLSPDWDHATIPELRQALQSMRLSPLALRQQAYHALHDITGSAYFSDPRTWTVLGYPGPASLAA